MSPQAHSVRHPPGGLTVARETLAAVDMSPRAHDVGRRRSGAG
jgi:hypothetical protein